MLREEVIEDLQNDIHHNRIPDLGELEARIKRSEHLGIDLYEEVLSPMGYTVCDRCSDLCEDNANGGVFWVEGFEFDENYSDDRAFLEALAHEPDGYLTAICWDCYGELLTKGYDYLKGKDE